VDFSQLVADVPTLAAVIIGVPVVLAAYIVGGEYVVRLLPDKSRPSCGRGFGSDRLSPL